MAYKRKRPGAYIGNRRYVRRKVGAFRGVRSRRVFTRIRRGLRTSRDVYSYSKFTYVGLGNAAINGGTNTTYAPSTGILTIANVTGVTPQIVECDIGFQHTFADLPESSTYASLYDQYKITCIVIWVELINNPNSVLMTAPNSSNSQVSNIYPRLWHVIDHDDNNAFTIGSLKQYSRATERVLMPNRKLKYVCRPTLLMPTNVGSSYVVNFSRPWLDMANTYVPYFGNKFAIDFMNVPPVAVAAGAASPSTGAWQVRFTCKYYFKTKCNR